MFVTSLTDFPQESFDQLELGKNNELQCYSLSVYKIMFIQKTERTQTLWFTEYDSVVEKQKDSPTKAYWKINQAFSFPEEHLDFIVRQIKAKNGKTHPDEFFEIMLLESYKTLCNNNNERIYHWAKDQKQVDKINDMIAH